MVAVKIIHKDKLRMKEYLILRQDLPDGFYITTSHPNWLDRMKLKLARYLFNSVKKPDSLTISTATGTSTSLTRRY